MITATAIAPRPLQGQDCRRQLYSPPPGCPFMPAEGQLGGDYKEKSDRADDAEGGRHNCGGDVGRAGLAG